MTEALNTKDDIKEIKEVLDKRQDISEIAKSIRIAPSKRAVLGLSKDLLLKHNALIFHKGSSLPSAQRKMIQKRISYGLQNETITPDEVAREINILNRLIQSELTKAIKENDNSGPEEPS
jgi:hypothetical protein